MCKTDKIALYMEKLFWLFLFINPFLDIVNGMYISLIRQVHVLDVEFISTLGVTPSLMVRMIMLVIFALYVLIRKDLKSILTAIPIGAAWVFSMASEYISTGSVQIFLDTQYLARFCFNIVLLMVYTNVFAKRWGDDKEQLLKKLNTVMCFTLALLALAVIVPSILGMGYSTYADRLGYRGSRGFFYAGNDITAILALLLPLCLATCIKCDFKNNWKDIIFPAFAVAVGINALLIIGSKTAFLACYITGALMLVAVVIFLIKDKNIYYVTNLIIAAALTTAVFLLLNFLSQPQTAPDGSQSGNLAQVVGESMATTQIVTNTEGVNSALLSGRDAKLAQHLSQFKAGGVLVWIFGLGRGSQDTILEMDVLEVLFYYGIFGLCAMMWLYCKVAIEFFTGFFKNFSITAIALFAALGICAGYLFIAGHVLFSVTSGFYFALVIVYSRVAFASEPGKILLWKHKKELAAV